MKLRAVFLFAAGLALGLLPQQAQCAHYKLFVLTGQSNSLGTTNGGEADPTSGSDPADQHVQFFWDNLNSNGGPPPPSIGDSSGVFTTLQDQQGGVFGGSATHWGPEIEFGRSLYRAGVRDFGIIKASRGGGGNSIWLKGSSDDHMYDHVLATVNAATADLHANGHTFEIVGLLYLQGESDGGVEITEAGTRLETLTDNLRADLLHPDTSAPIATSMHTVAAGTTAAGLTSSANQKATADITSYMDFFPNTDLADRLADGLHLNKAAKVVVGNRFAQTFLDAGIVNRHYGNLVFIGDSITQGGAGHPSYRYQVFTNLANASVPINATTGYKFVGSISGAYQSNPGSTPDVNGQAFENNHDGHWGWRAMWENGRIALPANRRGSNRGEGTILNWTGQASPQEYVTDEGTVDFPDLTTSGTGVSSPYTPYTPDTASIMIGINETSASSATQLREDIGTMIDQLRGSNANVRIHLNQLLYSDNVADSLVDAVNTLLPQLVADKNTASSTSPVWLVNANDGFVPLAHTHDNTHPNTAGEIQVGDILSGSLGIIEVPEPPVAPIIPLGLAEKASDALGCLQFLGSDVYNTGSFASGWSASGGITATELGGDKLQLVHASGTAQILEGTDTGWSDLNDGVWTFSTRIKFNANPKGFVLWLGTGTDRILVEIYGDRTQDSGNNSFQSFHNNLDGLYHTFKVTHDPAANVYHVWRDDVLLTDPAGEPYDETGTDGRLLMGDYNVATDFGDGFDVTIDYVDICGGYNGNEIVTAVPSTQVLWRRDWEILANNTTITASNLDGGPRAASAEVGTQDFTVVSGTLRAWDGVVGGKDLISTSGSGVYEATVEITDAQYAADTEHTLDFVIGTGSSSGLDGTWFVEFGTISGGVFTALPAVDSGSASYNSGAITLNTDENFMDDVNNSALFGYNVGGRLEQLTVDAADAVNGQNIAIRFGTTSSSEYAGFTDMALTTPSGGTVYSYINNWGHGASDNPNPTLVNTDDLRIVNTSTTSGSWLDASGTNWTDGNDGYWTLEARMKFDALPNGFTFWVGTGSQRVRVEIYGDRTQDLDNDTFNKAHNNLDGAFHTFRITHDPFDAVYHVWRDGERLTPVAGAGYDETASDNSLFFGDYTGGSFGNGFDATIDYIRWDTGNAYLPVGADADGDGLTDIWEDTHFNDLTSASAVDDTDNDGWNNLDEQTSDTDPNDADSSFKVSSILGTATPDEFDITVANTSTARNYTLYESDDLGITDVWAAVLGPVTGSGGDLVFTDTTTTTTFYRVVVEIPSIE